MQNRWTIANLVVAVVVVFLFGFFHDEIPWGKRWGPIIAGAILIGGVYLGVRIGKNRERKAHDEFKEKRTDGGMT